jgi:hypothetical protein
MLWAVKAIEWVAAAKSPVRVATSLDDILNGFTVLQSQNFPKFIKMLRNILL